MLFPPGTSSKRRSTTKEESSEVKHSWPSKVKRKGSEATNRHQPWDLGIKTMEHPDILELKNGQPITPKTRLPPKIQKTFHRTHEFIENLSNFHLHGS